MFARAPVLGSILRIRGPAENPASGLFSMFDQTVAALSALLKAKKVSSVELTQGYLDRINKYKDLNAFISVDPERSLAQARAADQRLAQGQGGPLTGVPIAQKDIFDDLTGALIRSYDQVRIGDPLKEGTLMGPLIDTRAVLNMQKALEAMKGQGGRVVYGGDVLSGGLYDTGTYVVPCICEARND